MDAIIYLAPAVFLLAGIVKGAVGMGLPTTVIALLSQFVDPRLAVALGLIPIVVSNLWQLYREGQAKATFKRFWPFALSLGVVIYFGSNLAAGFSGETIILVTGIGIALFSGTSLIRRPPALSPKWERTGQVVAGISAGILGGFTGLWAPPLVILLLSLRLEKSEFVSATGLLLFLGGMPMLAGYASSGLITQEVFLWSIGLCIPTFIGFTLGEKVRRKLNSQKFQKVLLVFFLLSGLNMIRRALTG